MVDPEFKKSNTRFYVIIAAIVIVLLGGLFFWFMGKDTWISGASTFNQESLALPSGVATSTSESAIVNSGSTSLLSEKNGAKVASGLQIKVSSDTIPMIKRETKAEDIEIKFSNLNTNIRVNKESLQLDSLQNVDMSVHGFVGEIILNEKTLSLNGAISRMQVNGIVLSSENMQIFFDGLDYQSVSANNMELEQLNLAGGDGALELLNGKISYTLENKDKFTANKVQGDFTADKVTGLFTADLIAQNLATSGSVDAVFS
ncbi:MAG: hypothetical protein AABX04_06940 [Nanoarchaeota archaeon]